MKYFRWRRIGLALAAALILAALAPLSGNAPHAAAGGSWSAWLYNDATGALVRVFPDGVAPHERMIPLPPGVSSQPYALAFDRTGSTLAACYVDDAGTTSVRVYDLYAETFLGAYAASGTVQGCLLNYYAFSEDGTQVAFGLFNHYSDPADPRPTWEVVVMDTFSGALLYHLTADDPAAATLGSDTRGTAPFIEMFQMRTATAPGLVVFKQVPYGTEGAQEYNAVVWNLTTNALSSSTPYGKNGLDVLLPNSELVYLDLYDFLPTGALEGPGFLYNVVMYSNRAGDLYPVFHGGAAVLGSPTFIDDGRRLAVYSYAAPGTPEWTTINRDGTTGVLPMPDEVYHVWGTLDGYVYFHDGGATPTTPTVDYGRFQPDGTILSITAWHGAIGETWRIVWVNPLTGGAGLPPFEAFPLLGAPPVLPATATAPALTLAVGGRATINTTEGDQLRIRSGPGTAYSILFYLSDGTPVTLREGPVVGGGYSWWRIETADGRSGWAVEGVSDGSTWLQTLVPTS